MAQVADNRLSDVPTSDPSKVPITEYLESHTKRNGGWRSFLHSNLFSALVIFILSQAVIVGGLLITLWFRTTQLAEWKGSVDATIKRMDEKGTHHSEWVNAEQDKRINSNVERLNKITEQTEHLDVLESEHRRLTKDFEAIKEKEKEKK